MKIIAKRRRHENKTNYSKRMRLLEGRKPRVVLRKSNKYIILQYVESKAAQDSVKASVTSKDLLDYGWPKEKAGSLKSLGAAYLAGLLFGKKIKKMAPAILDLGLIRNTKGSRVYSAVKGINDAGFKLPCSEEVFPAEKRIKNENISAFFDKVKLNVEKEKI
jgi:large subunit ribosomal protein L18